MTTLTRPNWQAYKISQDETHHIIGREPAYDKRFKQVLKFHAPGIAPVLDETGAYHIDPMGNALYSQRYTRTFGFYDGRAAVNSDSAWFHILPNGRPLYSERYSWCGNFQESLCTVKDSFNRFFHIDITGARVYTEFYAYAGDFYDGAAVVQTEQGLSTHIDRNGEKIHSFEFHDLDVFHKGFARAKDSEGWFHINRSGKAIYSERYAMIEPFYNGVARVETKWGALHLIDEKGKIIQVIREAIRDIFHEVSSELVSYWKLFTLKTAQDFKIFTLLPATTDIIAAKTGLAVTMAEKILQALNEMGYIARFGSAWQLSEKGAFLSPSHPYSLNEAQELWMDEHFDSWQDLTYSLQHNSSAFERKYQMNWFEYLDRNTEKRKLYHQALSHYARRDYSEIGNKIDFSSYNSVADLGGSTGSLLELLLKEHPHLKCHLLDLPSVIEQIEFHSAIKEQIELHPVNFFGAWPDFKVDAAILCRVIHDWSDQQALHILKQAHNLLKGSASRLYVIENVLKKESSNGALLNLNMLVMTGSQERSFEEFNSLFREADFTCERQIPLNEVSSIMVLRPL